MDDRSEFYKKKTVFHWNACMVIAMCWYPILIKMVFSNELVEFPFGFVVDFNSSRWECRKKTQHNRQF